MDTSQEKHAKNYLVNMFLHKLVVWMCRVLKLHRKGMGLILEGKFDQKVLRQILNFYLQKMRLDLSMSFDTCLASTHSRNSARYSPASTSSCDNSCSTSLHSSASINEQSTFTPEEANTPDASTANNRNPLEQAEQEPEAGTLREQISQFTTVALMKRFLDFA
jgi:hypothetical protein